MGEVKLEDLDENGLIKDEGRWNFKKTLHDVESRIRKH